jgi:DNA-binding transcriptional MerR regulator
MDEKIIEVDYSDITEEKEEKTFWATSEIAHKLGETDATIRVWADRFFTEDEIARSGRDRRFSKDNLKKLRLIKAAIREKGYSHKMIPEYLERLDNGSLVPTNQNNNDPLAYKMFGMAVVEEMKDVLDAYKNEIVKGVSLELAVTQEEVKDLKNTINDLNQTIEDLTNNQNKHFEEQKEIAKTQQDKLVEELKKRMEQNRLEFQSQQQEKKGFFGRIFG